MTDKEYIELIQQLRKKLAEKLPASRYEHSLSVSFTSICLAMRYGCDLRKAELAGLLHDCAKQYSEKELCQKCAEAGIALTSSELAAPQLIHARYGAYLARVRYGIEDEEILSAIRWHTVGHAEMTLLEAIVFTADYIEARRNKAENLPQLRRLAFENLDQCVYEVMKQTIDYLKEKGVEAGGEALDAFQYYKALAEKTTDIPQ